MKNKFIIAALALGLSSIIIISCSKEINDRTADLPALKPASADANAGTWKPLLLSNGGEIDLPAPLATTSPDYIAQINEIKATQANLTEEEKNIVKYWSAGGVLRWNELLRELVAKYNLPPYQNPDGTYPFPNANNPLAYPLFPFSNPPYAARAYAYVSAAQYDALVAAWHYKYRYNRPAAYKTDPSIKLMIPESELPSYPSEDAVIAGAAVEMLKLLFPGEQDFIREKAEQHMQSRIIAGANIRSELEAGEALGKAIAQKFVARARTDRAGAAAGNAASWKKLEDDCIARGEQPWISLESPRRPPMLPAFGKAKSFLLDSQTVVSLRPGPPPSVTSTKMKEEIDEVNKFITNPTREQTRIVHFWADGVGTYTPPGHWNAIAAEDFITKDFSEVRWARNLALVNIALMDAAIVCWETKYYYFNPRPTQLDPSIKTLTGIPNFPAYISGHSTFSAAAATILGHIIPERSVAYSEMAKEASISRVYGGIHYRSDCEVGLITGNNVGNHTIQRAISDGAE